MTDDDIFESGLIHGVAHSEDRLIPLLDLYALVSDTEVQTLKHASQDNEKKACHQTISETHMTAAEQG